MKFWPIGGVSLIGCAIIARSIRPIDLKMVFTCKFLVTSSAILSIPASEPVTPQGRLVSSFINDEPDNHTVPPVMLAVLMFENQAARNADFDFRRYAVKPMLAKPRIIIAQVEGSGTAAATGPSKLTLSIAKSNVPVGKLPTMLSS